MDVAEPGTYLSPDLIRYIISVPPMSVHRRYKSASVSVPSVVITEHIESHSFPHRPPPDSLFDEVEPGQGPAGLSSAEFIRDRRASMEDSVFADDSDPVPAFIHRRPPRYAAVNRYNRPGSATSSTSANSPSVSAEPTSRRSTLFGSLKLKAKRDSPRDSPSSRNPSLSDGGPPSELSPRRLANILEQLQFRQRSKSEKVDGVISKPKKVSFGAGGKKPAEDKMTTIPSVDENLNSPSRLRALEKVIRPLFVDTQLANRGGGPSNKNPRSPVTQMVDFVKQRSRNFSGSANNHNTLPVNKDKHHHRTPSAPATPIRDLVSNETSSTARKNNFRMMPFKSLDSTLYDRLYSPSTSLMSSRESSIYYLGVVDPFQNFDLENEDLVYSQFMKAHKCYDVIPTSSKLVVFDTQLPVKKAFFALVYNGVRAAPLWDNELQQFVGMLTITDFINILQRYHQTGTSHIKELEEHKISTWREVLQKDEKLQPVASIDPNESLFRAVELLLEHKIHRLPVTNPSTDNILYILTHKRLLRFLYLYIYDLPRPSFLKKTPKELGIGTWGEILTVHQDTSLTDALAKFLEYRVSALPVVDEIGRVVDIYAKFDVINLAADNTYNNLEITVQEALKHRSEWFEGVHSCKETDSLAVVVETLVKAEVHRLVVTDQEKRVCGIVSLSDILSFLVLRHQTAEDGQKETTS